MPSRMAIQLIAWFIPGPDGRLRLATEEEAIIIRSAGGAKLANPTAEGLGGKPSREKDGSDDY